MLPPGFKSIGRLVQEKRKIDFQDGGHLRFPIRMILAISALQVTQMLPTKFQVHCFFFIVLGFNDMPTQLGHFVLSPRERGEKR